MRLALFKNGQWYIDGQAGAFETRFINRYPNPSFESVEVPSGSVRSTAWSFKGTHSLLVTGGALYPSNVTYPSHSSYPKGDPQ